MAGLGTALAGRLDPTAPYPADTVVDALDKTAAGLSAAHPAAGEPECATARPRRE